MTPALFHLLLKKDKANDAEAAFLRPACSKRSGAGASLCFSLGFLAFPCSADSRLLTARRGGERVGLKVQFLLQNPGEDELGSDDGDRRRHGAGT